MKQIKSHLNDASIIGFLGSAFAALCCIGISAFVAFLGAIGASFILNDKILFPILFVSLALTLWGLFGSYRRDKKPIPFLFGIVGVIAVPIFILAVPWKAGVVIGLTSIFIGTFWNLWIGITRYKKERKLA